MAKRTPAAAKPAATDTHVRVAVNCAKCKPSVLVTTVAAGPDGKADQDELDQAILAAGWKINRAKQPICTDCG